MGRARKNVAFYMFACLVFGGLAVGIGWSKRTRAEEVDPSAESLGPPDVTYEQLSATPKTTPTVIGDHGDGQGVPAEVAAANSRESKADYDAIEVFWAKDRDKVNEAWSAFMVIKAKEAKAKQAEHAAATGGLGSAGVK